MNIMYCGDSNVVDGLIISILSIVKHIKEELHIYVLTMNFDKYKALSSDSILELENEIKRRIITKLPVLRDAVREKLDSGTLHNKSKYISV